MYVTWTCKIYKCISSIKMVTGLSVLKDLEGNVSDQIEVVSPGVSERTGLPVTASVQIVLSVTATMSILVLPLLL
jgi:type III secretory pathway lipoprotein EscJ